MSDDEKQQIIDFINKKYDDEVPGAVKFVVRRKIKKLEKLELEEFPESFRKCTLEELVILLKDTYSKKKLTF